MVKSTTNPTTRKHAVPAALKPVTEPSESPKRRRLAPEDREREIIEGAVRFFAEVGFEGGLRELAQRLGITHQNLFRYFPTKEILIDRVYEEVYLSRWRPEWEALLHQPGASLEARMTDFYKAYLHAIFRYDWVRIFVFAGLKGVGISQRYLALIQARVIAPLAIELRSSGEKSPVKKSPPSAEELEVAWGLHGELFYLAVRRWVYDMPVPENLDGVIEAAITRFLRGAPAAIHEIEKRSISKKPRRPRAQ
jgi:AcrR family transcriptional regulator